MHKYYYIKKTDYPVNLNEQLRKMFPYANLPHGWEFCRKEMFDDVFGAEYIGLEDDQMTIDREVYLKSLGFKEYTSEWFKEFGVLNPMEVI